MARSARRRTPVALLALLSAGAVLAGCGASAEPASPFPARPQDIDTSRLDPCRTLSSEVQAELGVGPGETSDTQVDGAPSRNCGWSNFDTGVNYGVQLIELDSTMAVGNGTVEEIAGYGIVRQTNLEDSAPLCSLVIDAHADQLIRVQVQSTRYVSGEPRLVDDVCREATTVATEVIKRARELER